MSGARTAIVVHSVYGLRPAVRRFGDLITGLGFAVQLVDLFDGRTTTDTQQGFAFADSIDEQQAIAGVVERARAAAEPPLLAGFSFGGGVVGQAVLAGAPAAALAMIAEAWPGEYLLRLPPGLPVLEQVADRDEFADVPAAIEAARGAVESGRPVRLRVYPTAGHLFMDAEHPDADERAAADAQDDLLDWLRDTGLVAPDAQPSA